MLTTLRSPLFVPGNKPSMLAKAIGLAERPDAIVPDMEDSVPDAEKSAARETIAARLPELAASGIPVIPRVNSLDTGWTQLDLEAVIGPHIAAISIGKVRSATDVRTLSNLIGLLEARAKLAAGSVKVVLWIETAAAIVNLPAICDASRRIAAVAFGAEDFTHDMEIERLEDDEAQLLHARSALCVAARAADVLALDTPYFKLKDPDGLRANALAAKRLGFKGKFAIHPEQIAVLNDTFAPSAREIEHARRVVAAYEEAERQGRGSTSLDGRVIDVPVVKRARALLALAERLGRAP